MNFNVEMREGSFAFIRSAESAGSRENKMLFHPIILGAKVCFAVCNSV